MKKLSSPWWDWPSASILAVMLLVASARLWATEWTPSLGLTQAAAFFGCVLGLALGYSRFQRKSLGLISVGYSLVILPWLWMKIGDTQESALQRLAGVGGRLGFAFRAIAGRQPVEDYLFFVVLMIVLFWLIAIFSGYQLTRHVNLLAAILPAGVGLVVIELYDFLRPERMFYLGLYLLLSLFLLGRQNLLKNIATWTDQHIATSSDIRLDISTGLVVAAFVLLGAAWVLPLNGYTFAPIENAWHAIDARLAATRQRLTDMLAAVEEYMPSAGNAAFGAEMALGRTAAQGDNVLFEVTAPANTVERYYWRARIYDTYTDAVWSNDNVISRPFLPDSEATFMAVAGISNRVTLVFNVVQPQNTLLLINDPFWISREVTATFGVTSAGASDLIVLRAKGAIRSGERYEVQSAVQAPTILRLRGAGTNYPAWVKERYLQLPANLSQRIKRLAEEITTNAETPYDKAEAITSYLRANITYTETLRSTDPLGGDPIVWMLFNAPEGFCNYYATAEVLMLRALGIPARLAVGYAQGEELNLSTHRVRIKDAHAWPEVYFPGVGWVEFEPTTAQPQLTRPSGEIEAGAPGIIIRPTLQIDEEEALLPDNANEDDSVAGGSFFSPQLLQWVIIFVVGGAWAGFLIYLSRRQPLSVRLPRAIAQLFTRNHLNLPGWLFDWLRWTEQSPAEHAFETINRCLRLLGKPQPLYATPSERAALLSGLLPEAAAAIDLLTQYHIGVLFSPEASARQSTWRATLSLYFFTLRNYFWSVR